LKEAVHHLEHFFEEQLQEAGKHIIENRKYIKRIADTLESILKARASKEKKFTSTTTGQKSSAARRRRRRRRS